MRRAAFVLAAVNPAPALPPLEYAGAALWLLAISGEALADAQLARFKRDPSNKGKVCNVGLWHYSRHPNYFFEWLIWVSFLVFALGSAISFVPMLSTVGMTMSSVLVAVAVNAVLLAAYAGSLAAVMAEQFPAEVRTAGISLPYGIAVAVFGGLTPVLATASLQHDVFWIFQAAMVALCLISAAVFWRMPETSGT